MAQRLVLASRNEHKVTELRRVLGAAGAAVELVDLREFPDMPEVAETGLTFRENALLKSHAVAQHPGLFSVADDSGLSVDVLGHMPGIFSARWAGRHGDDDANLQLVLDQLQDVPDEFRDARFVCAAALSAPTGEEWVVEGVLEGHIIRERRGLNGFGYDPIFLPEGSTRTTAEMSADEKDAISHRGKAFRGLAPTIASVLGRDAGG